MDEVVRGMQGADDEASVVRFRPLSMRMGVVRPSQLTVSAIGEVMQGCYEEDRNRFADLDCAVILRKSAP